MHNFLRCRQHRIDSSGVPVEPIHGYYLDLLAKPSWLGLQPKGQHCGWRQFWLWDLGHHELHCLSRVPRSPNPEKPAMRHTTRFDPHPPKTSVPILISSRQNQEPSQIGSDGSTTIIIVIFPEGLCANIKFPVQEWQAQKRHRDTSFSDSEEPTALPSLLKIRVNCPRNWGRLTYIGGKKVWSR